MSKRRAIILSVTVEGRSQAATARRFGASQSWVSELLADYREGGEAAFEPRSRRPKTSPNRISEPTVEAIIELRDRLSCEGLDAGPETIRWHLQQAGVDPAPSISTIRRKLIAAGRITPEPKKRPKSSYIRFEADLPNEMWQSDMCHWQLADGTETEILSWLDDHACYARYALSVTAHPRVNGRIVADTFQNSCQINGFPPQCCPTMPSTSRPVSPAAKEDATPSRHCSPKPASNRRTPDRTIRPPAAKSNASNRPSRQANHGF